MGNQTPIPVPPAKTASTKTLVEIFSVGQVLPSGQIADRQFLEKIAENWHKYQQKRINGVRPAPAYLIPAASITLGHEETSSIAKAYAERTDLPALGWPVDVQVVGNKLCCRLAQVPVPLVRWIESGTYKEISAEIYMDYNGLGPVLRRISFLGAEIPQCKDLASLPQFYFDEIAENEPNILAFAEKSIKQNRKKQTLIGVGNYAIIFSEKTMDRNQLIEALKAGGVDVNLVTDTTPNELLASVVQAMQAIQAAKTPEQNTEPAKLSEDQANLTDPVKNAEAKLLNELAISKAFYERETKRLRDERVHAECVHFCEMHKDKIYPYEMDSKVGVTLLDQLKSASEEKVLKFSEGGKDVYLSPREAMMAAIAKRPVVIKNRELIQDPTNCPDRMSDEEKRKALAASPTGMAALARKKG